MPEAPRTHERPDIATRSVFWVTVGLFSLVVIALIAVAVTLGVSLARVQAPAEPQLTKFPAPKLQTSPESELAALRAREHDQLHQGAEVPIEQAMKMIAARGGDAYAPLSTPQPSGEASAGGHK